jgi:hypothetical protein
MIKILKLVTGEEIIADAVRSDTDWILKSPAVIQLMSSRTDPNQIMIGLLPYAQYTQGHNIVVPLNFVIWSENPVDELYNQYNSMFGSGIQLA